MNRMSILKTNGFTLLEILIAMFIFSIVMTTIYATIGSTMKNIESAENSTESYQMARITLERIWEDLESAYFLQKNETTADVESIPFRGFIGENMTIEGRDCDSLRFSSFAQVNLERIQNTGISEIVYSIKENADNSFSLLRSEVDDPRQTADMERDGLVICDSVYSLNFSYYDEEGEEQESWNSPEGSYQGRLPRMISITLTIMEKKDMDLLTKFTTSVALPLAKVEND